MIPKETNKLSGKNLIPYFIYIWKYNVVIKNVADVVVSRYLIMNDSFVVCLVLSSIFLTTMLCFIIRNVDCDSCINQKKGVMGKSTTVIFSLLIKCIPELLVCSGTFWIFHNFCTYGSNIHIHQ